MCVVVGDVQLTIGKALLTLILFGLEVSWASACSKGRFVPCGSGGSTCISSAMLFLGACARASEVEKQRGARICDKAITADIIVLRSSTPPFLASALSVAGAA